MKWKQRGYADLIRNLFTPIGALALGVVVFAASARSAEIKLEAQQASGSESAKATAATEVLPFAPFSAKLPRKMNDSFPSSTTAPHDALPVIRLRPEDGGAASARASGNVGRIAGACTCDADCGSLDDINNCLVGICSSTTQQCEQEAAPAGTECDTDGAYCTLEECTAAGACNPVELRAGVTRSPCVHECVGGLNAGEVCQDDGECVGLGATCEPRTDSSCDDGNDWCETVGELGRCCSADGTTCDYVDSGSCASGLWFRISNARDLDETCLCPKYSSGIAPEGVDQTVVGPIVPSNKVCGSDGNICEGDGSGFCPRRCSAGSDTPDVICNADTDCAILGTCAIGGNVCVPSSPTTCVAGPGDDCVPDNPSAACLFDTCDPDPDLCAPSPSFLSVGDDWSFTNGSAMRLQKFRFRGGVEDPDDAVVFEFYDDSNPPLLVFTSPFAYLLEPGVTRTYTITFDCYPDCGPGESPADPPYILPANGHWMMRSSRAAENAAYAHVVSTDAPPDSGALTNDPDRMWIDGDPNVNQLGAGNNTLEFELVGEKVNHLGACCDPADPFACADTPEWECRQCPDGTPCSRGRDCGTNEFCLPVNWKGPQSNEDYVFGGGLLCASGVCTFGRCCDPADGTCSETTEAGCTGNFAGLGTDCSPNCCQQPVDSGADCACDQYQCSTDGGTTFTGEDCTISQSCTLPETCEQVCSGPTPHVLTMPFQCEDPLFPGGGFEPPVRCEPGAAGDALCDLESPGSTCILPLFDAETTITFTGDSTGATVGAIDGDTCALDLFDVGWHEAFQTDTCAIITVDHCCDPGEQGVKTPIWLVLSDGCPCGAGGGDTLFPDSNELGSRNGFGDGCNTEHGCCSDGNWAGTFTIRPGTYTWQIAGGGSCDGTTTNCDTDDDCVGGQQCLDTLGPYFGHVTYERCPLGACCLEDACSITDRLDCEDQGGHWLGGGDNPVTRCPPDIANPCEFGACCKVDDKSCDDSSLLDEKAECLGDNPANTFQGGVGCDVEPCPICTIKNDGNCKFDDDGRFIFLSDRAYNGSDGCTNFVRRVEDFRPAGNELSEICWWPSYLDFGAGVECASNPPADDFRATVYEDDGGKPGAVVGVGNQPLNVTAKKPRDLSSSRVWEYTGTLTSPIAVTPGACYWIEITGLGEWDGTSGCSVFLLESLEGNRYAFEDADGTFGPEDVQLFEDGPVFFDGSDIAYCVSTGLASNDDCSQSPVCCLDDGTAFTSEPNACVQAGGTVMAGQTDPGSVVCPSILDNNDDCANALLLDAGACGGDVENCTIDFDTRSATTDGPVGACFAPIPFPNRDASDEFVEDVWYEYVPTCSGEVTVDTCTDTNFDSMVAIFGGGACPGPGVICDDGVGTPEDTSCACADDGDGCMGSCFAASDLLFSVTANESYFVRVGGYAGSNTQSSGTGTLSITLSCPTLTAPTLAPSPHDILKNRYISIDALSPNAGLVSFDIKATLTSSMVSGVTAIGAEWWAGDPITSWPGVPAATGECVSVMTSTRPATPPDWSGCDTIHLTGCGIIPTSTYDIVIADIATESAALVASTQAKPGTKWWGDVVGPFNPVADEWNPPNGTTNIDDAVAAIKTFQDPSLVGPGCGASPCNATHLSVTDVQPHGNAGQPFGAPNLLVNINDVFGILLGFQGTDFPGFDVGNCP